MKYRAVVIPLLFFLAASSQNTRQVIMYRVVGKVTQTSSYCGGAAPSQQMIDELNKPRPYIGKVLYVRKGAVNDVKQPIVTKFTVDSTGKFLLMLPPGTYCIIQEEQKAALDINKIKLNANNSLDKGCLKDWWKRPCYVLEIKEKHITGLEINFQKRCFIDSDIPCVSYTGPYPP